MSTRNGHILTCIPQSLCSWDFRVFGAKAGPAELTFDFFSEQGAINCAADQFQVRKHGWLSGHWSLECGRESVAEAHKPSALFRCFEIRHDARDFALKPQSPLVRSYDISSGMHVVGTIRPAHVFTRRAIIECDGSVPEVAQLFAFWLAVLTWRRAARNNSGASSSS